MIAPLVRYIPDAVPDPDRALARLLDETPWRDTMRARRTASFGRPYNYSGQTYPAAPMPDTIQVVAARSAELAGHPFDNCLCNLYTTGHNTMGFHTDSYADLEPDSLIAIASLGATRPLVFRRFDRTDRVSYRLTHGSILLMDRTTQLAWEHAVPRAPSTGPRISLTFRRLAV